MLSDYINKELRGRTLSAVLTGLSKEGGVGTNMAGNPWPPTSKPLYAADTLTIGPKAKQQLLQGSVKGKPGMLQRGAGATLRGTGRLAKKIAKKTAQGTGNFIWKHPIYSAIGATLLGIGSRNFYRDWQEGKNPAGSQMLSDEQQRAILRGNR